MNKSRTSKDTGIDRASIGRWIEKIKDIEKVVADPKYQVRIRRKLPRVRKSKFTQIEKEVLEYFTKQREKRLTVDGNQLKTIAMIAYHKAYPSLDQRKQNPFKASNGWLTRFISRYNISSKAVTSVGQKIPENAKELSINFFDYCDTLRGSAKNFIVWNMDQMPVYMDSPKNRTYEFKGKKNVCVKTTGHEKTRLTVMLCADNSGRKLKPGIIFKGLKYAPKNCGNKVHLFAGNIPAPRDRGVGTLFPRLKLILLIFQL